MDAKSIRRMNVRNLAEEVGGITKLADMAHTSQSYLSQIIGPNPSRQVGDSLARQVEQATGRPHGWLDQSHITDEKKTKARMVFDALLELPEAKIDAVMQLLNMTPAGNSNQLIAEDKNGPKETHNRKRRSG